MGIETPRNVIELPNEIKKELWLSHMLPPDFKKHLKCRLRIIKSDKPIENDNDVFILYQRALISKGKLLDYIYEEVIEVLHKFIILPSADYRKEDIAHLLD